jgi:hypothetical protein
MNKTQTQIEKVPAQYSPAQIGLKQFLHTKPGAMIGHFLGISGFNKIKEVHSKFLRYYSEGMKLARGEFIQAIGETGKMGVYRVAKTSYAFNARVNKGADLIASLITGAAQNSISSPLPPKYIALSTSSLTPDKTDTTLAGETAATGLARALGTQGGYTGPSTLDGAALYTVTKTFINTSAGAVTVVSAALFDAAADGNMFVEANLSANAVMAVNDTLAITWTVNL